MTARDDTFAVIRRFEARGIGLSFEEANTLRRAELTLQRWAEMECGDSNDYNSWAIERDETTGKPYLCTYPHKGEMRRRRIADKEAGALKRIKAICERNGLHYFHQTDPRGCALYVSREPINDNDYSSRAVAVCA